MASPSRPQYVSGIGAALVAALLTPSSGAAAEPAEERFDVLLSGGTVVDGSGDKRYVADVGIRNGVIAAVGDLEGITAAQEIDVTDRIVAPGFIDVHSHGETDALRRARSSLNQGVTTEVLSPDGSGEIDVDKMLSIEDDGIGINVGAYVPFNSVWGEVVGDADRRAKPDEIRAMRKLVRAGLRDGAFGVSAGLAYAPAVFADTDQIIDVVKSARDWRTNFPNHIRNENDAVLEATEETITIGEQGGLVPIITHMKVMGSKNWGESKQTVGLIEDANARGVYTAADVYPYLRSQTGLDATVPAWVKDGGREAMLERFADPKQRPKIVKEIEATLLTRVAGPEGVWINDLGKTLAEVAEELDVRTGEAVIQVLEDEGSLSCIWTFGEEPDFRRILMNPTTAIASDGGASTDPSTHPRHYGTQPRVLARYVRNRGVLTLEEAVHKMTALPATMVGMSDRGYIEPGMAADITVFDPETITDRGTYERPKQYAKGIEQVLIGGRFALRDGALTSEPAGAALRRDASMPSRPVTDDQPVSSVTAGRVGTGAQAATVVFRARSADGETNGMLLVQDGGEVFTGTEFGRLQVDDGWASVTGSGNTLGGSESTFQLTIDKHDPRSDRTTVTVEFEDGRRFYGPLAGAATIRD